MKINRILPVTELVREYKENLLTLEMLKNHYEKFIKTNKQTKDEKIKIEVLETKLKLQKIISEIKAKENYISFFKEHDVRNRKK